MSEYNFQKFENVRGKYDTRISITSNYSFGIPSGFYKQNDIDQYKYVVVFFDPKKKAVALQFTNDEEEDNKFKIMHNEKAGGSIAARSFFKAYNLDPTELKGKYQWKKQDTQEEDSVVFIIDLKNNQEGE